MGRRSILLERSRTTYLITLALAMVLVASLFVWGFAAQPLASSAATAPQCTTASLDVWLDTNGNGAAGSSYYDLN